MSERIDGLINRLSSADDFKSVSWLLGNPVENIALNTVDTTIQDNVEFQGGAGLAPRVVRYTEPSGDKWPCDYCETWAGEYVYPDIPGEVWGRHENCRCIIDYTSTKGENYQLGGRNRNLWVRLEEAPAVNTQPQTIAETDFSLGAKQKGIKYNAVADLPEELTTDEIVAKIGGADKTTGSCASLAHTYVGNKKGFDVLDFRGGESRSYVSIRQNSKKLYEELGVKHTIVYNTNDYSAVHKAVKVMEEGHEYVLHAGRHASVVKKTGGKFYYLELQSDAKYNGWQEFYGTDKNGLDGTLRIRFGCKKSHTHMGQRYEVPTILVDIEDIPANAEYKNALGYINTPEADQLKGAGGFAK